MIHPQSIDKLMQEAHAIALQLGVPPGYRVAVRIDSQQPLVFLVHIFNASSVVDWAFDYREAKEAKWHWPTILKVMRDRHRWALADLKELEASTNG
jgi:hypothetical protein